MYRIQKILNVSVLLMSSLSILTFASCSSDNDDTPSVVANSNKNVVSVGAPEEVTRLEFPKIKGGTDNVIIVHKTEGYGVNYCTEYDTSKKSQRWSCYEVYLNNNFKMNGWKRANWNGTTWAGRTWTGDPFQKDPAIDASLQTPVSGEYSKPTNLAESGYQRGHIVASEDRVYSIDANGQTFYMTNMQPMLGTLNTGPWQDMEEKVRSFLTYDMSTQASHVNDTLYVCKGGTIDNSNQIYDHTVNGYIVPKYFFCAVLLKNNKGYQAIGFWFEHKPEYDSNATLSDYVVNIDKLEELTGIDFFCNLPDDIETKVESATINTLTSQWNI